MEKIDKIQLLKRTKLLIVLIFVLLVVVTIIILTGRNSNGEKTPTMVTLSENLTVANEDYTSISYKVDGEENIYALKEKISETKLYNSTHNIQSISTLEEIFPVGAFISSKGFYPINITENINNDGESDNVLDYSRYYMPIIFENEIIGFMACDNNDNSSIGNCSFHTKYDENSSLVFENINKFLKENPNENFIVIQDSNEFFHFINSKNEIILDGRTSLFEEYKVEAVNEKNLYENYLFKDNIISNEIYDSSNSYISIEENMPEFPHKK